MSGRERVMRDVPGEGTIEVRRSARRRRTVSAFREQGRLVIAIPGSFTRRQEDEWVARMIERVKRSEARRQLSSTDLMERAERLAGEYLPEGVRPSSVRWVTNQTTRWGSCTPRSEEHTSELQSRGHLVCRLLLEKKENIQNEEKKKYDISNK